MNSYFELMWEYWLCCFYPRNLGNLPHNYFYFLLSLSLLINTCSACSSETGWFGKFLPFLFHTFCKLAYIQFLHQLFFLDTNLIQLEKHILNFRLLLFALHFLLHYVRVPWWKFKFSTFPCVLLNIINHKVNLDKVAKFSRKIVQNTCFGLKL